MASKKEVYTLRLGRLQPFRRTVQYGKDKSAQLVFEPGVDVELDKTELEQCQDLIDTEMIVPADRDAKGRLRMPRVSSEEDTKAIEKLQKKVETLEAENAELQKMLEQASAPEGDGSEE